MQTIEATIVILTPFDHDPISIVSVYIPPNSDEYTFTIDIENLIQTSSNCVLFGDFNAPHTAWNCNTNSSRGVRLLDFTNLANLYIAYPDTPTRFGLNSANTLDIAIIRNFYYPYTINSLHELSSDHNPVMLNFTLKLNKDVTNPRAVHTNWPLFSNYLNTKLSLFNYHPNSINSNSDIDQKISEFTDTVRAAHSHASRPIETLRKSFTPHHIHKLIKQKNQYRNLYHRTLDPHYKTLYNRAQKNVKKELKNYTNENWTARLQALSTQDNSLWAVQKFFKNKRSDIPSLHCTTGTAITDQQKANILAESILENFTENERHNNDFDEEDEIVNNTVKAFISHPPLPTAETAYPSEIISYIKSSNAKKAPDYSLTKLNMFADDTAVHTTYKRISSVTYALNKHLKLLEKYYDQWKISINVEKSAAVIFTKKRKLPPPPTMYNTTIPWSQSTKYLGIVFDKNLTWRTHIQHTRNKFRKIMFKLYPLIGRNSELSRDNKVLLFSAVMRPILAYGCPVWGYAAKTNINILDTLQNSTIRMIVRACRYMRNDEIRNAIKINSFKSYIQKIAKNFFNSLKLTNNANMINMPNYNPQDNTKRPRRILLDSYNPP
ncbi:RNA-directed DNA polymerase from mobile element jockey [Trichonephila clavipes]|nr:RNA-directed DNA polymerase from mobile element jockey [Trichonephila clavipes]